MLAEVSENVFFGFHQPQAAVNSANVVSWYTIHKKVYHDCAIASKWYIVRVVGPM